MARQTADVRWHVTRRDLLHYLGVVALCPLGGFLVFVSYVSLQIGRPELGVSLVIWVVGYPIAAVAAGVLGFPMLLVQSRRQVSVWLALPAFLCVGAMGGALVYVMFFGKAIAAVSEWNPRLTFEYVLMGLGVSIAAWLLASFGPLRLSGFKTGAEVKHAT
jgi:hypothetical protein